MNWKSIVGITALVLMTFISGIILGVGIQSRKHYPVFALGLDKETNTWNAIKVNKDGEVLCNNSKVLRSKTPSKSP